AQHDAAGATGAGPGRGAAEAEAAVGVVRRSGLAVQHQRRRSQLPGRAEGAAHLARRHRGRPYVPGVEERPVSRLDPVVPVTRSCVADSMRTLGLLSVLVAFTASAVGFTGAAPAASPVQGLYTWIHSTGDAERSFSFYREVFGIELARSPFAGAASAITGPEPIRPVSPAGSDAL